jgi:hypothetical protein
MNDIGFSLGTKNSRLLFLGYFFFAIALLLFIEIALANTNIDSEKMNELSSLTPRTTTARIIFILMAFVGGISEEIVYRGFAITSLIEQQVHKFLAVTIASIPFVFQHGLKSIDQFWWFFVWAIILGCVYLWRKNLFANIIVHWLVVLSAMLAILQVIN